MYGPGWRESERPVTSARPRKGPGGVRKTTYGPGGAMKRQSDVWGAGVCEPQSPWQANG